MSSVIATPPEQGQLVNVRSRQWIVTDVRPSTLPPAALKPDFHGPQHLLTLSGLRGQAGGPRRGRRQAIPLPEVPGGPCRPPCPGNSTVRPCPDRGNRDRRPAARAIRHYSCWSCGTTDPPVARSRLLTLGWVVFTLLLVSTGVLCWLGLLIREQVQVCPRCGLRVPEPPQVASANVRS
jgi:hypothetical protein